MAERAEAVHGRIALSIDWEKGPIRSDLKNEGIYCVIRGWVGEGLVAEGMIHLPCETWSPARHGLPGGTAPEALRNRKEGIWGLPGLKPSDQVKVEEGNAITRALFKYLDLFQKNSLPIGLENGDMSMLWFSPELVTNPGRVLKVCYCMMGKPFRKRTRLMLWGVKSEEVFAEEEENCRQYLCNSLGGVCRRTGQSHVVLRGWNRGKALTLMGNAYPR